MGGGVTARAQQLDLLVCPAAFPQSAATSFAQRSQEIARLQPLAATCLQRADFYAYQGQLLLMQERFVDALAALERALLLDSGQPGVQLDYVIALAKTGDLESARALAQQVLERSDAPVAVRLALEDVMRQQQQPPVDTQASWQWRGSVQTLLGKDSNLNSATSADAINLTLPNGNVSLLLDESSKPKSGAASVTTGQLFGQTNTSAGLVVVQADWRERAAPGRSQFGYSQQDASVLLRPHSNETLAVRLALSSFSMGGSALFAGQAASTWKEFKAGTCSLRAGLETERRSYAQDNTQDGTYASTFGLAQCSEGANSYIVGALAGKDWASNPSRAGGSQARLDVRASWDRQWQWARTSTEWVASRLRDERPYSFLLGGTTRSTLRQNFRISVIKKLNSEEKINSWGGLYSVSVIEVLRHRSNLELFDVRSESLYTGLRYEF